MNAQFRKKYPKWKEETLKRHKTLPYFQCKNFKKFKQIVKNKKIRDIILEVTDRTVRQFKPDAIILFGSYATGNATPDSDIDLLVIFKKKINMLETVLDIGRPLEASPIRLDFAVMTPNELINDSWRKSSFYNNIFHYGFHLYEKDINLAKDFLKSSKKCLTDVRKYSDCDFLGYRAIKHAMYAAIIYDGLDLPKGKNLDDIYKQVDKSWKISKFKKYLKLFPSDPENTLSNNDIKIIIKICKTIYNEFKLRKNK